MRVHTFVARCLIRAVWAVESRQASYAAAHCRITIFVTQRASATLCVRRVVENSSQAVNAAVSSRLSSLAMPLVARCRIFFASCVESSQPKKAVAACCILSLLASAALLTLRDFFLLHRPFFLFLFLCRPYFFF